MKITKKYLQKLIKEETQKVMSEISYENTGEQALQLMSMIDQAANKIDSLLERSGLDAYWSGSSDWKIARDAFLRVYELMQDSPASQGTEDTVADSDHIVTGD
jgi:hypothetical protein